MAEKRGLTDVNFQTNCRDFVLDCLSLMEDSFREAINQQGQDRFAALTDAFGAGRAMSARLEHDSSEGVETVSTAFILLNLHGESNFADDLAKGLVSDPDFENAMRDRFESIVAARVVLSQSLCQQT